MARRISIDLIMWTDGRVASFAFDTGQQEPACHDGGWMSSDDFAFAAKIMEVMKETGLTESDAHGACDMPEDDDDESPCGGVVYFIRAKGVSLVKIGYSSNPEQRLRNLQTSCPHQLDILATLPGSQQTEADIHKKFGHLRMNGEWFRLTSELFAFIGEITAHKRI